MSSYKTYFKRNNTIISGSFTNTGQNPVTELFFGNVDNLLTPAGYSRFIFDLDLDNLKRKVENKQIIIGDLFCPNDIKHVLRMKNTSSFDKELLNDKWSNGRRRASSFTLNLYRIPYTNGGLNGEVQTWDEGVGFDYYENMNSEGSYTQSYSNMVTTDKTYSSRPSNFFQSKTTSYWSSPGIYSNIDGDGSLLHVSDLDLISSQVFEFGDEDIEFDMTDEVNLLLSNSIESSGYIIAFPKEIETITGLTESYSVGFFTRHTQTFYEPYLETTYNDLIQDDRNLFVSNYNNKLYLYSFDKGIPKNLDNNPVVDILDQDLIPLPGFTDLSTCQITEGVYQCEMSGLTAQTIPCMFYDLWKDLSIDGNSVNDVENTFILQEFSDRFNLGILNYDPSKYSFSFSGIKQDEKILSTDVKKINVDIKKAYSSNRQVIDVTAYYRIYVKEGEIEVQVQDWTQINRTSNSYYFIIDMNDKIPNEYFVDMKVITNDETNTYKRELKFQIVSRK
jgi:hypothetical protein